MNINNDEFQIIKRYVVKVCGVVIPDTKKYLVEQRILPLIPEFGLNSPAELCHRMQSGQDASFREKIIDVITTHETFFFRDSHVFQLIADKIIPDIYDSKKQMLFQSPMQIWCAACSTGQEPYTISILLDQFFKKRFATNQDAMQKILATDISRDSLKSAENGCYNEIDISRGLKPEILNTYFTKEGNNWRVKPDVKRKVSFRHFNLLDPAYRSLGSFDLILCRNVLIYFDVPTRQAIADKMWAVLKDHGYLILGSSENLMGSSKFEAIKFGTSIIYKKIP